MPRLLETHERAEEVTAAANHVLVTEGPWGLTLRAIGQAAGLSPGTLLHQFTNRERLLRICAHRTGKERMDRVEFWAARSRLPAFLPNTDDDLHLEQAWQQWLALARCVDWMQGTIDPHRVREHQVLARVLGLGRDDPRVIATRAFIDGICTALCDPLRPLTMRAASELLERHRPHPADEPPAA